MTRNTIKESATDIRELVDNVGAAQAGDILGLSRGAVSEMISSDECRPAFNMAARYYLDKQMSGRKAMYVVSVPDDKRETLEAFLSGMRFTFSMIETED